MNDNQEIGVGDFILALPAGTRFRVPNYHTWYIRTEFGINLILYPSRDGYSEDVVQRVFNKEFYTELIVEFPDED